MKRIRTNKGSNYKVTDEQVVEMRRRRRGFGSVKGESLKVLSKAYGISEMSVSRICTGQAYAHLPGPITRHM